MNQAEREPTDLSDPADPSERAEPNEPRVTATTGHPQVDAVLSSMDSLADRPLEEHVAVFEQAHQTLRGALSEAAAAPRGPQQG